MDYQTLLVLFVGVSAFAFTIQCLALWRALRAVQGFGRKLEKQATLLEGKLETLEGGLSRLSADLKPLSELAESLNENIGQVAEIFRRRSEDADLLLEEVFQTGREQVSKIDYLVTDTVRKFEETTEVIQKDILRPAIEISSLFKGIKAGLDVLFSRGPKKRTSLSSDDPMFI